MSSDLEIEQNSVYQLSVVSENDDADLLGSGLTGQMLESTCNNEDVFNDYAFLKAIVKLYSNYFIHFIRGGRQCYQSKGSATIVHLTCILFLLA